MRDAHVVQGERLTWTISNLQRQRQRAFEPDERLTVRALEQISAPDDAEHVDLAGPVPHLSACRERLLEGVERLDEEALFERQIPQVL